MSARQNGCQDCQAGEHAPNVSGQRCPCCDEHVPEVAPGDSGDADVNPFFFDDVMDEDTGEQYVYAHCFDEEADTDTGCGMEYEFYPDHVFESDLGTPTPGILRYWHDAVGLVKEKRMTPEDWKRVVAWHQENCGRESS